MRFLAQLLLACWLTCTAYCVQAEPTEFKIITLQHRFASELLPAIQSLMGEEGTASALNENLLIRATPSRMAEIEQLISILDTPHKNLRVTVSYEDDQQSERSAIDTNAVIRAGRRARNLPSVSADVDIALENTENASQVQSQYYLNVIEGERAFIRVGESVAFTQQWLAFTQTYAHIQQTTAFREIATGFAVRPRQIGNQIELEITPRITSLNSAGVIDFEALSTVVRVRSGQWFDLGGAMQTKDDVSRAILGKMNERVQKKSQLQVKVDDTSIKN